jgi:hypothetical protein
VIELPLKADQLVIASAVTKKLLKVMKESKGDCKALKEELIKLDKQIDTSIADLTIAFWL